MLNILTKNLLLRMLIIDMLKIIKISNKIVNKMSLISQIVSKSIRWVLICLLYKEVFLQPRSWWKRIQYGGLGEGIK